MSRTGQEVTVLPLVLDDGLGIQRELEVRMFSWKGRISVMAGHFMVVYREAEDRLLPLIRSVILVDKKATRLEREYVRFVGDFPELTFRLGARLVASAGGGVRKLLLLVDDHQFLRFSPNSPRGEHLSAVRRRFYRSEDALPSVFKETLGTCGLTTEDFEQNSKKRSSKDILPNETFLFSEAVLRNSFSHKRIRWLSMRPGFAFESDPFGPDRLVYEEEPGGARSCVIGNPSEVACSSTAIELLVELDAKGVNNVLWFVPQNCCEYVYHAILLAMSSAIIKIERAIMICDYGPDPEGNTRLGRGYSFAVKAV